MPASIASARLLYLVPRYVPLNTWKPLELLSNQGAFKEIKGIVPNCWDFHNVLRTKFCELLQGGDLAIEGYVRAILLL